MRLAPAVFLAGFLPGALAAQAPAARTEQLKQDALQLIDQRADLVQRITDQLFSYGELGFQESETSRYLTELLRREGFTIETGVAGMPTAWIARWGSGKPVIALGADLDGIPKSSQVPGVACRIPLIDGAPGHGEGHNAGQAVTISAALAVKRLMQRERIPGTLVLWPGVAEELLSGKAWMVRAGLFKDVDLVLFAHVGDGFGTAWGSYYGSGLVSLEYRFEGTAAHAAGQPERGRSALDALELMDIGWNFRREHLPLTQRSHYVITDGGDQPNVVPARAAGWYFLRELDYPGILRLWAVADSIAEGAALMTGTHFAGSRVLGSAWPRYFNRPLAEALDRNIQRVGMPAWSVDDQRFAKAVQHLLTRDEVGLSMAADSIQPGLEPGQNPGGPSDDIGDIAWNVPTAIISFPSNIPGVTYHHWSAGMAMATPIAHKGALAGAKATALTVLDALLRPGLVDSSWTWFRQVQTRTTHYQPLIRPEDNPPTELNRDLMARYRDRMRATYYDPTRYKSYLEQLGVRYPVLPDSGGRCPYQPPAP
ncbi:MAG TPA: amidohydrolase [Gemmatimonadales bacterium]|nr:amidohydrolase [Gemmatimonadales bacterium]